MKTLIAFVCVLAAACGQDQEDLDKRIVNGEPVTTSPYTFLASLQIFDANSGEWHHHCGAELIEPDKLLTAAHCVAGRDSWRWRVVLGVTSIHPSKLQNGQIERVKSFIVHPDYDPLDFYNNDIAIVYLDRRVRYNKKIKPAKLAFKYSSYVGSKCVVTGWGDTETKKASGTYDLMHAHVTKISNQVCQHLYPYAKIRRTNLCLFEENEPAGSRPDACQGDSGGPVMCGANLQDLAGITSWGVDCGAHHPGVYTRVSEFLDWIHTN
ncbi:unnamed protein product [Lymnaea stagnalis]|uniref:Acrosin n=1 Tax=Lymnaea stagnalis TaxID=6523 RepID=A0AAV2I1D0_LYMST